MVSAFCLSAILNFKRKKFSRLPVSSVTYEPSADTKCWLYECPGPDPADFEQEGTPTQPLVYWLDLQAVPDDDSAAFGWKTSPDQWNDSAVWASGVHQPGPMSWQELQYPQGHPFAAESLDLALEIWGDEAPPVNGTVCEPGAPHHESEYWYRVTQTSEWCAFHVRVLDENPSNYSNWNVPPGWVFEVHGETDGWWATWRDSEDGCPNAISGTFTYRFTNPNPSKWDIWVMNTGNSLYPSVMPLDGSCNHALEPDGYGHMVHVPAVCALTSDPPAQPLTEAGYEKNRYLTFAPANPGRHSAIRVTFADLPPEFDYAEGRTMWVGEPGEYTENAGKLLPSEAPGFPTFWAAELQCDPYYMDWGAFEEVHVYYGDIIPGGTFDIQMIDKTCYTTIESNYSEVLAMDTSIWGDVLGTCAVSPCSPPNGTVGIPTDVTGVLDKFKNLEGAPTKARCDIEPKYPDLLVNISDVTYVLEAFRGFGYPFAGPAEVDPCP